MPADNPRHKGPLIQRRLCLTSSHLLILWLHPRPPLFASLHSHPLTSEGPLSHSQTLGTSVIDPKRKSMDNLFGQIGHTEARVPSAQLSISVVPMTRHPFRILSNLKPHLVRSPRNPRRPRHLHLGDPSLTSQIPPPQSLPSYLRCLLRSRTAPSLLLRPSRWTGQRCRLRAGMALGCSYLYKACHQIGFRLPSRTQSSQIWIPHPSPCLSIVCQELLMVLLRTLHGIPWILHLTPLPVRISMSLPPQRPSLLTLRKLDTKSAERLGPPKLHVRDLLVLGDM